MKLKFYRGTCFILGFSTVLLGVLCIVMEGEISKMKASHSSDISMMKEQILFYKQGYRDACIETIKETLDEALPDIREPQAIGYEITGQEVELNDLRDDMLNQGDYLIDLDTEKISGSLPDFHAISICKNDKCSNIDFGGDEIVFSGELGVDEAAKIFFEQVFVYLQEACEKE